MTEKAARRIHQSTKHGTPPEEPDELVSYQRLDPSNAPRPFKEYLDLDGMAMPREVVGSSLPARAVLSGKTGERASLDVRLLSTLLFLSDGVTRVMDRPGRRIYFRTAMSAGNLHPIELYVVAGGAVEGLGPGVYHFSPLDMRLTRLRSGDHRDAIGVTRQIGIVLTGIPWRTTWKYAERGWRHLYWDSGTLLANTLAVADAHGLAHQILLGFDDDRVSGLVGIDGVEEMPLAVLDLGDIAETGESSTLDTVSVDVAPIASAPIRLPMLQDAQTDGALDGADVEGWRAKGSGLAGDASSRVELPNGPDDPIEDVILRRGSTREMIHETVSKQALDWPMAASTRSVGIDATGDGTLLDHYVNVHAVEDMDEAAYRFEGSGWERIGGSGSLRQVSAGLCLGQELGGDSAYTIFHCAELDPIFDSLGSRGYRVAQLEAGVVSGRLALCAFALGLGATGLTFLDDAVSAFFGIQAQPMLVTAVGVPVSGPAPSGSPGNPVVLGG